MPVTWARLRPATAYLTAAGLLAALPAGALADASGGAYGSPPPSLRDAKCLRGCNDVREPKTGASIRLSGRDLGEVRYVVFLGGRGAKDDVRVKARNVRTTRVDAVVPKRARSGRLRVITVTGRRSRATRRALAIERPTELKRTGGKIDAQVNQRTVFFAGRAKARLDYVLNGSGSQPVRIDLVRAVDEVTVVSWSFPAVPAGVQQAVEWDGRDDQGALQPEGRYEFRVYAGQSAQASGQEDTLNAFNFLRHKFPVRGPHDYGGDEARFGAGRDGHSHQGHDVFAKCGTPLAAARGGIVKTKAYHSAAGYYVVIDGAETDVDYVYMHLRKASSVKEGDAVYTGQLIGEVGETGRASGCHLHFEMWQGGWYDGGSPIDPYPYLRDWDSQSGTQARRR